MGRKTQIKRICLPVLYLSNEMFNSKNVNFCRESAIKFNDYFEFSREFDMEPYTVQGLAKIEGNTVKLLNFTSDLSRDTTKPAKWLYAEQRLRSAWASA